VEESLFVIVVVVVSVLVVVALFAIALGRAAASEDEAMERLIAERRRELSAEAERAETPPSRERLLGPRPGPFSSRESAAPSREAAGADDDALVGSRARRRRRWRTPAA
jgi:hypothetical protein